LLGQLSEYQFLLRGILLHVVRQALNTKMCLIFKCPDGWSVNKAIGSANSACVLLTDARVINCDDVENK
jgi:hypothetical protein